MTDAEAIEIAEADMAFVEGGALTCCIDSKWAWQGYAMDGFGFASKADAARDRANA